jgi:hypothetical protein
MRATALIYSGRMNPTWNVTGPDLADIEAALAALPPAPPGTKPPLAGLGYSGVLLETGPGQPEWTLFQEHAVCAGRVRLDVGRRLELKLLRIGAAETGDRDLADLAAGDGD